MPPKMNGNCFFKVPTSCEESWAFLIPLCDVLLARRPNMLARNRSFVKTCCHAIRFLYLLSDRTQTFARKVDDENVLVFRRADYFCRLMDAGLAKA